jgi:hypothetical protein
MATQIVCCEQTGCARSGHIVAVGVGTDPSAASNRMTVSEVYSAMDRGVRFYTEDRYGNQAWVHKYACPCGRGSLRSAPDCTTGNNLDNLRICSWRAA